MLAVSTSPIIARYLENVPAVAISFWRMGFGALILWIVGSVKKQVPLQNENLKRTLIAGILLGIHFALFFGAIKLTTIANATFLGTLAPLITFFIEKFILKRNQAPSLIFGLGLAIVKHIVNRHRGRLSIESLPGETTTFTVYLPLFSDGRHSN